MSLFDQLVEQAMRQQTGTAPLRMVVEKELLHHDILREMGSAGLLTHLTFIGGTCLRACYGSSRLSEDLDFTGGADFNRESLAALAQVLVTNLERKYGLKVEVGEPRLEAGNVDTWKMRVQTRPGQSDMPTQRINIDICAPPSHDPRPMMLRNHYGIDMGTGGLVLQAQSREEILADKLLAFALRSNRLKNRDVWDMVWLHQQGVVHPLALLPRKLSDRHIDPQTFVDLLTARYQSLADESDRYVDFKQEMRRFLPASLVTDTVEKPAFWQFAAATVADESKRASDYLLTGGAPAPFRM